ncbi:MAG TPA: vanadium-dependent haloperoxidase, partial [Ramlibacter sp.]|nr:vanadium-dependent haloperoxidase [Ramlibacter sp.]
LADLAVFNALNAIEPRYQPYGDPLPPAPDASPEAAVAAAQWTVLAVQPELNQERLRSAWRDALARIPDSPSKARGIALGQHAGASMLALRAQDHGVRADTGRRPPAGPGVYELAPGQRQEAPADFGRFRPLAVRSLARLDPGEPAPPGAQIARRDLAEIASVGARDSRSRTAEQTLATLFWDSLQDGDSIALYAEVARANKLSPLQTARMLALATMAEFDAGVAIMAFKEKYRYWRPIMAIRSAHTDPALRDPAWEPLLRTPPHPDYPSGGGVIAGVLESLLPHFNASGNAPLVLTNRSLNQTRRWPDAQAMARELALSRLWGGIHFRNTILASMRLGRAVADEVLTGQLRPLGGVSDSSAQPALTVGLRQEAR